MIDPKVARELSWAAGKLREVARALSALSVRLTSGVDSDRMTAPRAVGQEPRAMREDRGLYTGECQPIQLTLDEIREGSECVS